jgi:hypothetical protein
LYCWQRRVTAPCEFFGRESLIVGITHSKATQAINSLHGFKICSVT